MINSNPSSNIRALRFLWQQALAHQALSPSVGVIVFLAELGYWEWAYDLALIKDDLREQENIWVPIAKKMAAHCPEKAIVALDYLVRATEDEASGWQCRYLCVAAQLVAELNLDNGKGMQFLDEARLRSAASWIGPAFRRTGAGVCAILHREHGQL